jgi:queuine tRNA-ribosyltransferase
MTTAHGMVETPVFMPVGTLATVKGVPHHLLEDLGAQIILANNYHLYLRPGIEQVRKLGGLHRFMSWDRAILTDSGGFQVFSLNELRKVSEEGVKFRSHIDGSSHMFTPESAIAAQIGLGADIIMAFDECTEYPAEQSRAQESMEMTLRWAARCRDYFEEHKHEVPWNEGTGDRGQGTGEMQVEREKGQPAPNPLSVRFEQAETQALFGIVQGGMYTDMRAECAKRLIEIDFPGYAIGGLSVGEPARLTREIIEATLPHLPPDKPRYVMGVGYPDQIVEYAAMGVDMMDCVLPTRAARHGLLFTSVGRLNIKNTRFADDQGPADPNCGCWVCQRYTRAYLRHLFTTGESLGAVLNTVHNLAHYLDTMRAVRHAIKSGKVSELLAKTRAIAESTQESSQVV